MSLPVAHLSLAARNLWRQPRRSALAIGAIAFGIISLMLASGFIEWIYFDMRESTIHSQIGHIQVTRPGYHEAGPADLSRYLLPAAGSALDAVRATPGVRAVAPRLSFSGLASIGETTVSFIGEGVDPANETDLSKAISIVEGRGLSAGETGEAILGVGLAANLGAKVGDKVVLLANKPSGGVNAVELRVAGLFQTITKAFDDSALRVPIATARKLTGFSGSHAWVVLLDDTAQTDEAVGTIRAKLAAKDFAVVPWSDLADFYRKTVALFSKQVSVVKVIIAVIIVLSISNTMMMSVLERVGEIGTMMALGTRRRSVLGLFVAEGGLLGLVGGAIGVVIGLALAAIISHVGIPMPPPPGMAHGFTGEIRITGPMTIEAFLLAAATAVVASLYPAWRASRLIVVDAIRRNR